ncbi:MAG: hypothetical protein AB7U83_09525 [Vicinamibacterales bacterium]
MAAKRGRPLKFGRPTQLLSVSLPADVVAWLRALDPDPAWAIVSLFEKATRRPHQRGPARAAAELVRMPGKRALILVRPDAFAGVRGVSVVPLSDGRGFLALDAGHGIADLEVAVVDRLDATTLPAQQRAALSEVRHLLRDWRQQGLQFVSRSILVAIEGTVGQPARALSGLASVR